MNGMLARSAFVLVALGLCALAIVAWHEPSTQLLETDSERAVPYPEQTKSPDQGLLLFIFSLTQGSNRQP